MGQVIPLPATKTQDAYKFTGEAAAIAMRILKATMEGRDGVAITSVPVGGFERARKALRSQGFSVEIK